MGVCKSCVMCFYTFVIMFFLAIFDALTEFQIALMFFLLRCLSTSWCLEFWGIKQAKREKNQPRHGKLLRYQETNNTLADSPVEG